MPYSGNEALVADESGEIRTAKDGLQPDLIADVTIDRLVDVISKIAGTGKSFGLHAISL